MPPKYLDPRTRMQTIGALHNGRHQYHRRARRAVSHLEIPIDAPRRRVWRALFDEINDWWLPDFHMTGPGSRVSFECKGGGRLLEQHPEGSSLLWCTVHWVRPEVFMVYLYAHAAPDWGGPSSSTLRLEIAPRAEHSLLKLHDAHFGNIDEENIESIRDGWTRLFTQGLKRFAEEQP